MCGLQDPFSQEPLIPATKPPFIQILHIDSIHWNTVVAIDDHTVKMYDSLYRTLGQSTSMQSAAMLQLPYNQMFSVENTQK